MSKIEKIDENQIKDFDLIATAIVDGSEKQIIKSARKFYEVLGFDPANWSRWYKANIENNPFAVQNVDFQPLVIVKSVNSGNFAKDFKLSLEFAERLAMMARTEKGEEVRRYFQKERDAAKKMREQAMSSPSSLSRMDILKLAVEAEEENLKLKQENQELECMVIAQDKKLQTKSALEDHARRILSDDEYCLQISTIASKFHMTGNELNEILLEKHIIKKLDPDYDIVAKFKSKGYAKRVAIPCRDGKYRDGLRWSRYGEAFIQDFLKKLNRDSYAVQLIPLNQNSSFIH